jgi:Molybdopterin converting factor, large subunit
MIKIQKKDFNIDNEIKFIKEKYSSVGAVNTFIGYVRDLNNKRDVKYLDLEVYKEMAIKELSKIKDQAVKKWNLIDCLIIHRYGKLFVNDKIVLVVCYSEHRNSSFEACKFIMDYLKKDAPFWKKEFYNEGSSWLQNTN